MSVQQNGKVFATASGASLPLIGQGKLGLGQGLGFDGGRERLPNALHGGRRSLALGGGAVFLADADYAAAVNAFDAWSLLSRNCSHHKQASMKVLPVKFCGLSATLVFRSGYIETTYFTLVAFASPQPSRLPTRSW